jgi:uncharacterized protein (TIGR01777 family)
MKIIIPGGTGRVGSVLARALHDEGHEVVVLSRRRPALPWRVVEWDGVSLGPWSTEVDGSDVVINLAGRDVNCRYTAANRQAILESRTQSTRIVGEAISRSRRPPHTWLQASTATIYAHRYDAANDEATGVIGGAEAGMPSTWRFSIEVARAWERALADANTPRTRKIALRSAMTMSPDAGGIFDTLLRLARFGIGGTIGNGRQYVSWIHEADFIESIRWLIAHDEVDGVINVAAPNPLPQSQFMSELRRAAGVPFGLPATEWMAAIGAFFMRTETELVLKSRRVVPRRLLQHGFTFRYPAWPAAAMDLCGRSRGQETRARRRRPAGAASPTTPTRV